MSQENINNIFINENVEEGEVEQNNQDNEEEKENEEGWGGAPIQNEIIIPNMTTITAFYNIPPISIPREQLSSEPQLGRVRRREEYEQESIPNKVFRNAAGKRIIRERTSQYSYLRLKSGEEFHFKEEDSSKTLINEVVEPNRLIRNIISRVPKKVADRMEYLGKFNSEEDSDEENSKKVEKRYFGNLKELVYEAYIKEWRLRFIFKRLVVLWRIYKMNKSSEKEIDPITLSEPEKEVYVYDWANKKKFVFDAKSIATMIESKLMYQEYGFPVPMYPRNPKNNVEFSYKQLVSLYYQLKKYGELRWGFTTLREYDFNKNRWHMYHKSALTINSIKASIYQLDTIQGRELLSDFIFAKMEEVGFRYTIIIYNIYQKAMDMVPNHWYLEKLKSIAILHYEAEHFGHNKTRIINAACVKIFRKFHIFLNDLKNKNIIR